MCWFTIQILTQETCWGVTVPFLERQLPQINSILSSRVEDIINQSEVVMVSQKRPEFLEILKKFNRQLGDSGSRSH